MSPFTSSYHCQRLLAVIDTSTPHRSTSDVTFDHTQQCCTVRVRTRSFGFELAPVWTFSNFLTVKSPSAARTCTTCYTALHTGTVALHNSTENNMLAIQPSAATIRLLSMRDPCTPRPPKKTTLRNKATRHTMPRTKATYRLDTLKLHRVICVPVKYRRIVTQNEMEMQPTSDF